MNFKQLNYYRCLSTYLNATGDEKIETFLHPNSIINEKDV